jgi:hypothetical protein
VVTDDAALWLCLDVPTAGAQGTATVWEGLGLYFAPMIQPAGWATPKTKRQDLGVFELQRSAAGSLEALCLYVQGTQAGSGTSLLRPDEVQRAIDVTASSAGGTHRLIVRLPHEVLAPFQPEPHAVMGLNLTLPGRAGAGGPPVSLSPVQGFESPREPGRLTMTLLVIEP